MNARTRRDAVRIMRGAGLATIAAAPARAFEPVDIPDEPLRLSRSIEHQFHDGSWLSVFRSWEAAFWREGQGIIVFGEQVEAAADGSPEHSSLAQAERARSADGIWPVRLSSTGLILASGSDSVDSDGLSAGYAPIASLIAQLPDDLFYPSLGPLRSVQAINLPGGVIGEFSVDYQARSVPEKGWLDRAERTITTRVGATRERVVERWLLTSI